MKKIISLLLIIVLTILPCNQFVQADNTIVKPTYTAIKYTNGVIKITFKHKDSNAKIYYQVNKGIDSDSKYVKSGNRIITNELDARFIIIKAVIGNKSSKSIKIDLTDSQIYTTYLVPAPSIEIPTYVTTVDQKGNVTVTFRHSNPKAKIYYHIDNPIKKYNKYVAQGKSIKVNYKDAVYINVKAKVGNVCSEEETVNISEISQKKYTAMYKEIVNKVTAGKISDEDKLIAIYDWLGSQYTFLNSDIDVRPEDDDLFQHYLQPRTLLFEKKALILAFFYVFKDMATYAGYETKVIKDKDGFRWVYTNIKGKWFESDLYKLSYYDMLEPSGTYGWRYAGFMFNHTDKCNGIDTSSKRYNMSSDTGEGYFYLKARTTEKDGTFVYDKVEDKYSFVWNEEDEE